MPIAGVLTSAQKAALPPSLATHLASARPEESEEGNRGMGGTRGRASAAYDQILTDEVVTELPDTPFELLGSAD
eukprot:SAG31_NODE_25358_length_463_cov_0.557692_1_plen_73_part_10